MPLRGPLASQRTSLAIFIRLAASVFSAPCACTSASAAASASNLFGAVTKGSPVSRASSAATCLGIARRRVQAVPTAVPPSASSHRCGRRAVQMAVRLLELRHVAGKFLAQRQRRRVLQVGAADLDDVVERLRLRRQRGRAASSATAAAGCGCASTAATCIAVGNTSLDDWLLLTSSFGWTSRPSPRSPPSSSLARLASTSFTFMLVCVPEPVCQTTSGNSSSCWPASTSSAAAMMAEALRLVQQPQQVVDDGRGALDLHQRPDDLARLAFAGNVEILQRALGLRAPQPLGRNLDRPESIPFGAGVHVGSISSQDELSK